MRRWFSALDGILRGEVTRPANLRAGRLDLPVGGLTLILILLGFSYGFCMGWFALFDRTVPEYWQVLAAMLKVPALFFLTLLVTFPSLYVFNALVGSQLDAATLLRLLLASLSVTLAVLASFGPIVAFFSVTTDHYPFMVLLNVVVFALAGSLGLSFLLQTLHRLNVVSRPTEAAAAEGDQSQPAASQGALEPIEPRIPARNVTIVFRCWVVIFALVGGQMSWVLRPFIGRPDQPFEWFRTRHSNFFESVWTTLQQLFS